MGWGGPRIRRRVAGVALASGAMLWSAALPSGAHPARAGGQPCGQNRNHPCTPPCADDVVSGLPLVAQTGLGCAVDGVVDNADQLCSTSAVETVDGVLPNGDRLCGNS